MPLLRGGGRKETGKNHLLLRIKFISREFLYYTSGLDTFFSKRFLKSTYVEGKIAMHHYRYIFFIFWHW